MLVLLSEYILILRLAQPQPQNKFDMDEHGEQISYEQQNIS